ncbi:MAG TPA: hypothetical protein VMR49_03420 [Candidatus Paceibacterota bacterium]|nr:hypothetical protein [Candidatus Paceibacterota bacterium]
MGFLFKQKNNARKAIIFDIGSGSVGGAFAHISSDANSLPTIIKSFRKEIKFRGEFSPDLFIKDTISALNSVAISIYNEKIGVPDEIVCVLASPWYLSETRTIKISKEHSFIFREKFASDLIKKEISKLNSEYQKKYKGIDSVPELIENRIMSVLLDNHRDENPIGKSAKSLEMSMLASLSPKLFLNKMRDTLSNTLNSRNISFSSFMLASYLAVRDKYVSPDSYILLDIGGEITDIGIVSRGVLETSISFPFGKNTFLRHLCANLHMELRDAGELLNLFMADIMEEKRKNKIKPIIESIKDLWHKSFRQCVYDLRGKLQIPKTVFLTADADIKELFIDAMKRDRKCAVVTLEGQEFLNMCSIKDNICDPFLMIEAIAIARRKAKII